MRVDLHVHSKYSTRPSQWFLQKIGCAECFTDPYYLIQAVEKRGMDFVTITDHNRIEGALEIAHLPHTFISEEITTYFPDDGCKVHVLAHNISESQHRDIQKARENVFELVDHLQREQIFHVLAHPLYSVNDQLTLEHFEQLLLLFKNFELNGSDNPESNDCLRQVLSNLNSRYLDSLAEKYGILPKYPNPWQKNLVGGSDDHCSIGFGRTYTEVGGADSIKQFFGGIQNQKARVVEGRPTPKTFAHTLYSIAYQFYYNRFTLERYVNKDFLLQFLDRSLRATGDRGHSFIRRQYFLWQHRRILKNRHHQPQNLIGLLRNETSKFITRDPLLQVSSSGGQKPQIALEEQWFDFVNKVSNRTLLQFADNLLSQLSGANLFNLFHTLGSAGGSFTLLAPYFVAFSKYSKQRQFNDQIRTRFIQQTESAPNDKDPENIALFTDTFYDINELALSLQQQVQSALKHNKRLKVITCDVERNRDTAGIQSFQPIGIYEIPGFGGQKLFYPPLMDMLDFCYAQNFSNIHAATPGPMGLAALLTAKLFKLPIRGTYYAPLAQYAQFITQDGFLEDLTWRYAIWFYNQMERVYVPSKTAADTLAQRGIDPQKIRLIARIVDIDRFHPGKRNERLKRHLGIHDKKTLLYVGRVAPGKNLDLLAKTFRMLSQSFSGLHLIIVGEGPYLDDLRKELKRTPYTFTGYLDGDDLAAIYAFSDIFISPGTAESLGNAVLEAQASGIPVVVSDQGGPQDNILPNKTGLVFKGGSRKSLLEALQYLLANPKIAASMGHAARKHMEECFFDGGFHQAWTMYSASSPATASQSLHARDYAFAV